MDKLHRIFASLTATIKKPASSHIGENGLALLLSQGQFQRLHPRGVEFTAALETLGSLNAEVLGVSRDSTASHRKFADKHGLGVKLLSDADHKVMESYGSWAKKKMYGRESFGTVRSTFLINPEGNIAHQWRSVKVKGHVEAVIKALQDIH